jgi:integrase/recombinase XerD
MNKSVSTAIILDKRFPKSDGTFPVKLRVTYLRKQKYYSLKKYSLDEDTFSKIIANKPRAEYKDFKMEFMVFEKEVNDIIDTIVPFSFFDLEKLLADKYNIGSKSKETIANTYTDCVFAGLKNRIIELENEQRLKTASAYKCALVSMKKFFKKNVLPYKEVTPAFLNTYERWMDLQGNSKTTIGFYLRTVRNVFNIAKENEIITLKQYPFGKMRYRIPKGINQKKALTKEEILLIKNYEPDIFINEALYRDYWLFLYLCNGINVKDMALLKYKDLKEDIITISNRAKTARTQNANPKPIHIVVLPDALCIMNKWGNKNKSSHNYIFPILKQGMTAIEQQRAIDQTIQNINKNMKRVTSAIGLEANVTTYVARHSFATVLKRSGVPISFISDSLGHTDLKTTENYLDSFEDKVKREFVSALI